MIGPQIFSSSSLSSTDDDGVRRSVHDWSTELIESYAKLLRQYYRAQETPFLREGCSRFIKIDVKLELPWSGRGRPSEPSHCSQKRLPVMKWPIVMPYLIHWAFGGAWITSTQHHEDDGVTINGYKLTPNWNILCNFYLQQLFYPMTALSGVANWIFCSRCRCISAQTALRYYSNSSIRKWTLPIIDKFIFDRPNIRPLNGPGGTEAASFSSSRSALSSNFA